MEAAGTGSLLRKLPETNTHGWEDLGITRKPAQVSSTGFSAGSELLTCCCIGIFQGNLEHAGILSTKSLGTAVQQGHQPAAADGEISVLSALREGCAEEMRGLIALCLICLLHPRCSRRIAGSGAVKPSTFTWFDNKLTSHTWLHLKKIRGRKKESCWSKQCPQMLPRSRTLFCDLAPTF